MVMWCFRVGVAVVGGCGVGRERLSMAVGGRRWQWAMSAVGSDAEPGGSTWGWWWLRNKPHKQRSKQQALVFSVWNVPSDVAI